MELGLLKEPFFSLKIGFIMIRLLTITFCLFISYFSNATTFEIITSNYHKNVGDICVADHLSQCVSQVFPSTYNGKSVTRTGNNCGGNQCTLAAWYGSSYTNMILLVIPECSSKTECFALADKLCKQNSGQVDSFEFIGTGNYSYTCVPFVSPAQQCENQIVQECENHFGLSSSLLTDDGSGSTTCTGVCTDGTIPSDIVDCNVFPYCDVAEDPSELDVSGSFGSDVSDASTTTPNIIEEDNYTPDGTNTSETMTGQQGDSLINAVNKSVNDNTENLASTTKTTNQTITEKSDDIISTLAITGDGIIDAVNRVNNYGVIEAVNNLGEKLDGLSSGDGSDSGYSSDYALNPEVRSFTAYDALFTPTGITELEGSTDTLKDKIKIQNNVFKTQVLESFSIDDTSTGTYQARVLTLNKWGSHDISIARFVEFFGGVGNIVYFLAALSAAFIVLGGVKL